MGSLAPLAFRGSLSRITPRPSASAVELKISEKGTAFTRSKTLRICGCGFATSTLPPREPMALRALNTVRRPAELMYSRPVRSSTSNCTPGSESAGSSAASAIW